MLYDYSEFYVQMTSDFYRSRRRSPPTLGSLTPGHLVGYFRTLSAAETARILLAFQLFGNGKSGAQGDRIRNAKPAAVVGGAPHRRWGYRTLKFGGALGAQSGRRLKNGGISKSENRKSLAYRSVQCYQARHGPLGPGSPLSPE